MQTISRKGVPMAPSPLNIVGTDINEEPLYAESYKKVLPEIEALDAQKVRQVNLDVPTAVATVLGALPEILAQRADVAKEVAGIDLTQFDKLEEYAMALSYAHTLCVTAARPPDDLVEASQEAVETRDRLHADAAALSARGLINPESLKDYKGLNGYKNAATDLQILVSVLKEQWPTIEGKCAANLPELDRADKLALRILRSVGLRDQCPVVATSVVDNRARAFSIFMRAYDTVQRAVCFLRWDQGDADTIAPSLYAGRKRKPASDLAQPTTAAGSTPTADGSAAPVAAPAVAAAGGGSAQPSASVIQSKAAAVGLPGSHPFMS
jgi:hypothetical protein